MKLDLDILSHLRTVVLLHSPFLERCCRPNADFGPLFWDWESTLRPLFPIVAYGQWQPTDHFLSSFRAFNVPTAPGNDDPHSRLFLWHGRGRNKYPTVLPYQLKKSRSFDCLENATRIGDLEEFFTSIKLPIFFHPDVRHLFQWIVRSYIYDEDETYLKRVIASGGIDIPERVDPGAVNFTTVCELCDGTSFRSLPTDAAVSYAQEGIGRLRKLRAAAGL
jgi:hypothetical protein